MLHEDDIKKVVVKLLKNNGYGEPRVAGMREHGPDIFAFTPTTHKALWIEAKGETSSDPRTNRYGRPFDSKQKRDHLGKALLKSLQWISASPTVLAGIALPADKEDVHLFGSIRPALKKLGITVFLVHEDGKVDTPIGLPK